MTERQLRKSTQDLRKCYPKARDSSRTRVGPRSVRPDHLRTQQQLPLENDATENEPDMADPMQLPAPQVQIPAEGDDQQNQNPNPGQEPNTNNPDPAQLPASPERPRSKSVTSTDMEDHDKRIKTLEQALLQKADTAKTTTTSTDRTRSRSRRSSGRTSYRSRHSHSPRRENSRSRRSRTRSRRRTPSRSRSRRYSSRSHRSRSRSRRRSRSRHSRSRDHRSTTRSRATRSRSRRRASPRRRTRTPPSRSSRQIPTRDRDTATIIDDQYPNMGNPTGRRLPRTHLTLEPYHMLPPDLKKTARARRSRRDLSFPEYMCGFLNMVSEVLDPATEAHAAITHAAQMAQDAVTTPWSAVREWSQACLATLEGKKYTWLDEDMLHRERMRLSWIKGRTGPPPEVPCHDWNMATCTERAPHEEDGKKLVHECAICMYGVPMRNTTHPAQKCRKRPALRAYQDDGRTDGRRKPYNSSRRDNSRQDHSNAKN